MDAVARLDLVIFDAVDIDAVGAFYAGLTGWDVVRQDADRFGIRDPSGQEFEFQRAPDHVQPRWPGQDRPQQFHLDLRLGDPRATAERAIRLGARLLADVPGAITLVDPAGHPFDLCAADTTVPFTVTVDAPDAGALASFYAGLLGEVPAILRFQQVTGYQAPRWPDPAHPQQAHLDLLTTDLAVAQARAIALGARSLDAGAEHFKVFADPAGHPFCLIH
ncbi:VOC family protein [Actinoplanes oblitus]|uniref:VOC family protein n=1 Tax=Actinoplanes oblitus TaxID=3040509 RepID=A0ABY8WAE7_9ACTN|nr:VOC family protein [Actinoplanes oblitus]WIM93418.1 VOC family protein [Actinoplanes oblitus]